MRRHLVTVVCLMAMIGLMAGSASAAAVLSAGNVTVAAEKIASGSDYTAGTGFNVAYQPAGIVPGGTALKLTLTNGTFGAMIAGALDLCLGTTVVATTSSGNDAGATSISNLTVGATTPLSSAQVYTLTNAGCATGGVEGVSINKGSADGTVVTLAIDRASATDATIAASGTAYTVKNQFSALISAITSKLSFSDSMKLFVANGSTVPYTTATQSIAGLKITSDESINDKIDVGGAADGECDGTLAAADVVKVKLSGNLTSLKDIQYEGGTAETIATTDVTAGFDTLSIAGDTLKICRSDSTGAVKSGALKLAATGSTATSAIVAGDRTVQVSLGGAGVFANTRDLVEAGTVSHTIQLDATQAVVPYLHTNPAVATYCVLNNNSDIDGAVTFDVISSEGKTIASGIAVGTLSADETKLLTFSGASAQLAGGTAATIPLGENVRYAAKLNINAPPANVFINCQQSDPVGAKRLVPVLTEDSYKSTAPWKN